MSELKAYELKYGAYGMYLAEDGHKVDDNFVNFVYPKAETDKVIAELEESHKKEVEQLLMEIVKLKEERRWRKFPDEKPTEEMEGMDFIVSNGYYSVVCEWRGYWNNEPFCGDRHCDEVKYWRPLPAEPKEWK